MQAEPSSTIHLHRLLGRIREPGKQAGVALNPATPLAAIDYVLHLCDIVLVMTVNPGFGGQPFLPEMLPKIRAVKAMAAARGLDPHIEIDGGINAKTIRAAVEAGADALVAGSAIFGAHDYAEAIARLREAAATPADAPAAHENEHAWAKPASGPARSRFRECRASWPTRSRGWLLRLALPSSGRFALCLSGGSTPKALYQRLAQPALPRRVPLGPRRIVFFGDERFVPDGDKDNNLHDGLATPCCRMCRSRGRTSTAW